jgi:hypothetical protein
MASVDGIFLGFDPGGKNGFGAAALVGQHVATTTVSTVADACSLGCRPMWGQRPRSGWRGYSPPLV